MTMSRSFLTCHSYIFNIFYDLRNISDNTTEFYHFYHLPFTHTILYIDFLSVYMFTYEMQSTVVCITH